MTVTETVTVSNDDGGPAAGDDGHRGDDAPAAGALRKGKGKGKAAGGAKGKKGKGKGRKGKVAGGAKGKNGKSTAEIVRGQRLLLQAARRAARNKARRASKNGKGDPANIW